MTQYQKLGLAWRQASRGINTLAVEQLATSAFGFHLLVRRHGISAWGGGVTSR
jgi:hypothetical protein